MEEPCVVRSANSVCRLCLCGGEECFVSVFDENHAYLPQRIAACVNVEVHTTDKMSTVICKPCLAKIENWFEFKKCCEDAQSKLRQWVQADAAPAPADKCMPLGLAIKEEAEADSGDQLQIVDTSMYIKAEPLYQCENEAELVVTEVPASPASYTTAPANNFDSLLVPARECPATVHGIHAPYFSGDGGEFANDNQCRVCGKAFSSTNNRNRHERNLHSAEREASNDALPPPPPPPLPPLEPPPEPSGNVTLAQFAASLQLVQTSAVQPAAKPVSERQFVAYNRKMCAMLETGTCHFCHASFTSSKTLMRHLAKKIHIERFSCFFCCISFPNRSQFMQHNLKKYCKQRARMLNAGGDGAFKAYQHYECRLCNVLYVHKLLLSRHLVARHLAGSYPAQCARCATALATADQHRDHLQGPCYYRIYCSICKATYDTLAAFEAHTAVHEGPDASLDVYLKPAAYAGGPEREAPRPVGRPRLPKAGRTGCPVCPKRYSSYDNMLRHFKDAHKRYKLHRCARCTRKFATEADLQQHVGHAHRPPPPVAPTAAAAAHNYSCSQCGALFPTLDQWCTHQKSHAAQPVFQCGECSRVFGAQDELDEHRTQHPNNIKLKLYRCSNSNSYTAIRDFSPATGTATTSSVSPTSSSASSSSAASTDDSLDCSVCLKSFGTHRQLQKHLVLHDKSFGHSKHPKAKRGVYGCLLCDKTFALATSLWKHCRLAHGGSTATTAAAGRKKRRCSVCHKVLGSVRALWHHRKKCQGGEVEAPVPQRPVRNIKRELYHDSDDAADTKPCAHICDICNKAFPTLKGLSIHAKLHAHREHVAHGARPKCQVCGDDFHNIESLLDHMKSHSTKVLNSLLHMEVPRPVAFECPVCGKAMQNNAGLASHLKTHAGEPGTEALGINDGRGFKCAVCKMRLMTAVSLANHMRAHGAATPQQAYTCTVCKYACTGLAALRAHHQHAHRFKGRMATKIALGGGGSERFACALCPRTFAREHLLEAHVRACHAQPFRCGKCQRGLATATAYVRHARQFHNRLVCTECNKFFDSEAALCAHKGWHNRRSPSPAAAGDAAAAEAAPEDLKCVACDAQFHSKGEYAKHMHTHKEPFKCRFCARVFSYLKPLRKHISFIHSNELARSRAVLKKAGATKAGKKLLRGVEVKVEPSAENAPYKCTECHTGFLNSKKLRLHVLSAHLMGDS